MWSGCAAVSRSSTAISLCCDQREAKADQSEGSDVHAQEMAWAERHAHERRLHDSAIAQLRHR